MSSRSYGNYDSNVTMKTFSGQPLLATKAELNQMGTKLAGEMMHHHADTYTCQKNCPTDCSGAKDPELCQAAMQQCMKSCYQKPGQ